MKKKKVLRSKFERACQNYRDGTVVLPTARMQCLLEISLASSTRDCKACHHFPSTSNSCSHDNRPPRKPSSTRPDDSKNRISRKTVEANGLHPKSKRRVKILNDSDEEEAVLWTSAPVEENLLNKKRRRLRNGVTKANRSQYEENDSGNRSKEDATHEMIEESWAVPKKEAKKILLGSQASSGDSGTPLGSKENMSMVGTRGKADFNLPKQAQSFENKTGSSNIPREGTVIEKGKMFAEEVSSVLTEADGNKDNKSPPEDALWVQCIKCLKWRNLPVELGPQVKAMKTWICQDNVDGNFADCSIPQEKTDEEINLAVGYSEEQKKNCWTQIKQSIYTYRKRNIPSQDEILICQCKPPEDGSPGCGDGCLNRMLCIECVPGTCPCGEQCSNQRFQKQLYASVEYFRCGKKGFGLRMLENVPCGTFIIEYVGEVLDLREHEARQEDYAQRGQKHFYFMSLNKDEVIDACKKGNLGRYINHSCSPNCQTEKWTVNGEVCIGFFAKRDLVKGEEVTFDYNYVRVLGAAAKKCECASAECRGFIGGDSETPLVVVENESDIEEPEPVILREESQDLDIVDYNKPSQVCKTPTVRIAKAHSSGARKYEKPVVIKKRKVKLVPTASNISNFSGKGLPCSTSGRAGGVEEKINEMLDQNGGIAKRKDVSKHYLQLLCLTALSGEANGETSGSIRELSMILDGLLKTESRIVLTEIVNMNGLQLLHTLIKKTSKDYNKTPIIRKLLKILHKLTKKKIITAEKLISMPRGLGVESFETTISNLVGHNDNEVHKYARILRSEWNSLFSKKQMHNGPQHGKILNQNQRNNFQHSRDYNINKTKAPWKQFDSAHNGFNSDAKVRDKNVKRKYDAYEQRGFSSEQFDHRNVRANLSTDSSREHSRNDRQHSPRDHSANCSNLVRQDQISNNCGTEENKGNLTGVEEQRNSGNASGCSLKERQWSQWSRKDTGHRNVSERWSGKQNHRENHWQGKLSREAGSSISAHENMWEQSREHHHKVVAPSNYQDNTWTSASASSIGVSFQPQGNQVGNASANLMPGSKTFVGVPYVQHGNQINCSHQTIHPSVNGVSIASPIVSHENKVDTSPITPPLTTFNNVPVMSQGNPIADISANDTPSKNSVVMGIPVELLQQVHGLPVSIQNIPKRSRQPGATTATAVPCLLPCKHFSMSPGTKNVHSPVSSGAIAGSVISNDSIPDIPSHLPAPPRPPRIPSNRFPGNMAQQSNRAQSMQANSLQPPVPGLSPPVSLGLSSNQHLLANDSAKPYPPFEEKKCMEQNTLPSNNRELTEARGQFLESNTPICDSQEPPRKLSSQTADIKNENPRSPFLRESSPMRIHVAESNYQNSSQKVDWRTGIDIATSKHIEIGEYREAG